MATAFLVLVVLSGVSAAHLKRVQPIDAQSRGKSVEIELVNEDDNFYFAEAEIGGQSFRLLVDTSYGYLRVDSADCSNCTSSSRFDKANSPTYKKSRDVFFNRVPAEIGKDTAVFGELSVSDQPFALMKKASNKNYREGDGVLGLAFEHPDVGDIILLENLKQKGLIDSAIFSLFLNEDVYFIRESSYITFGGWDLERFSLDNKFIFVDADMSNGLYSFPLTKIMFNGKQIQQTNTVILSTSQDRMIVPKAVYKMIYDYICSQATCVDYEGEPSWRCAQVSRDELSDLTFQIGTMPVTIDAYQYTLKLEKKTCGLNIRTMAGVDSWILGTHFLRNYYVLFDTEQQKVGFATANHDRELLWGLVKYVGIGLLITFVLLLIIGCIVPQKQKQAEEPKEETKSE